MTVWPNRWPRASTTIVPTTTRYPLVTVTTTTKQERRVAWKDVVREIEEDRSVVIRHFPPDVTPETEIRSDTRTGVAVFAPERQGRKLLVAYLADDRTGELLGAGSHQDFDNNSDEGTKPMLRFKLAETTQAVRVPSTVTKTTCPCIRSRRDCRRHE